MSNAPMSPGTRGIVTGVQERRVLGIIVSLHGAQNVLPLDTADTSGQESCFDPNNNVLEDMCPNRRCCKSKSIGRFMIGDIAICTGRIGVIRCVIGGNFDVGVDVFGIMLAGAYAECILLFSNVLTTIKGARDVVIEK